MEDRAYPVGQMLLTCYQNRPEHRQRLSRLHTSPCVKRDDEGQP